jgi:hypothetical protein
VEQYLSLSVPDVSSAAVVTPTPLPSPAFTFERG